jgi:ankyrin repeat protein
MYFKITNEEENHHGLQYRDGLVKDNLPFAREGSCVPGGIYFTDLKFIPFYFTYGVYIREVTVPPDAEFVKDNDKYRASKVILGPRRHLKDIATWQYLINLGLDISDYNNMLFEFAICNGYFELFIFLLGFGTYNDHLICLNMAIHYGNLEIVSFLLHVNNCIKIENSIFISAILNGNLDIIKLLLETDKKFKISYLHLKLACSKSSLEVVKYFVTFFKDINYTELIYSMEFFNRSEILKYLIEFQKEEDNKIMKNI